MRLAFLVLVCGCAAIPDPEPPLAQELQKLLVVIDHFDPHSVMELPFVRISSGMQFVDGEGRLYTHPTYAFVIHDDGKRIRYRQTNLRWGAAIRSPKDRREPYRVDITPVDFTGYVRNLLHPPARDETADYEDTEVFRLAPNGLDTLKTVTLIRACLQRGMREEADALWDRVTDRGELQNALAPGMNERLLYAFAEPYRSREELLRLHQSWLKLFPDAEEKSLVEERVAALEKSIEGSKLRKEPHERSELIVELVRSLEDEVWTVPTGELPWLMENPFLTPDAPRPPPGTTLSERLIAFGTDAAPALIAALGDPKPTRCVELVDDDFDGSWELESIGDHADRLLRQISGFYFQSSEIEELKGMWRRWHQGVTEKGEPEYLAGIIRTAESDETGDGFSCAAHRLLKRWPDRFEVVVHVARTTKDERVRTVLLEELLNFRHEGVTTFFLEGLTEFPDDGARLLAANSLLDRGRREGIPVIVEAWKGWLTAFPGVAELSEEKDYQRGNRIREWSELTQFFLKAGDPDAIREIGARWAELPALVRKGVLEAFWRTGKKDLARLATTAEKERALKEIERLLLDMLEDRERTKNRRHCDEAASYLAEFWPDRYRFDENATHRKRENVLAGWRQDKERARIHRAPVEKCPDIEKAIDRVVAAAEDSTRTVELENLVKRGLATLPPVLAKLRSIPGDHPSRPAIDVLANRLSNFVGETHLIGNAPAELTSTLESLAGRPLTPDLIIELAMAGWKALPDSDGAVEVVVDRIGDGTGLRVDLLLQPGRTTGKFVRELVVIRSPRRSSDERSERRPRGEIEKPDGLREARTLLRNALSIPHDRPMEAVLRFNVE